MTGRPSSEKAMAPAASISPRSASCSLAAPWVMAPTGCTAQRPAVAARSRIISTIAAESQMGLVFGMQAIAVTPPRAAAAAPVATVSLSS